MVGQMQDLATWWDGIRCESIRLKNLGRGRALRDFVVLSLSGIDIPRVKQHWGEGGAKGVVRLRQRMVGALEKRHN